MSTNTVPVVSGARQPRALVQANGTTITGLVSLEFDEIEFSHPSTFKCSFALDGLPASNNAAWWASQKPDIDLEIFIGFPSDPTNYSTSDLTSMFVGRSDEVVTHWEQGLLEINGRDLSSLLIDLKSSKKYPNLTASKIATQIAGQAGLTPVVTATKTLVGKYYQIDKVQLQDDRTEWDLLTWLAREEQFVVFVKGHELHFQPKPGAGQTPYLLQFTPPTPQSFAEGNFTALSTTRELTMAKDIKVVVRSWNSKQKKAFSKIATRSKKGSSGTVQEFSYTIAGLDPEQAQARANQILAELSQHECKISFEGPAENSLAITDVIQLAGTGTAFDQVYFPSSIMRTFDVEEGYRWTVEAKNHATESEPTL